MDRNICISCGSYIVKSAFSDPYMCRECEKDMEVTNKTERFNYLDNYI